MLLLPHPSLCVTVCIISGCVATPHAVDCCHTLPTDHSYDAVQEGLGMQYITESLLPLHPTITESLLLFVPTIITESLGMQLIMQYVKDRMQANTHACMQL
jgi:hypothetical protein